MNALNAEEVKVRLGSEYASGAWVSEADDDRHTIPDSRGLKAPPTHPLTRQKSLFHKTGVRNILYTDFIYKLGPIASHVGKLVIIGC